MTTTLTPPQESTVASFADYVLQRKKEEALVFFREAYTAQQMREYDEAVEKYRRSIEIYPTAEAHTFLGWTYSFLGDLDAAILECEKAIKLDPEFGNPYNDIGAYLIAQGHPVSAIPYLQDALNSKRYRAFHFAHFNLARAFESQGNLLNAFRHYKKAIEIEPNYELAVQALANLKRHKLP
jgi:tetratricopeptide (TPR) repeat protein